MDDAGRALGGLADAGRALGELADAGGSLEGLVVDVSSSDAMVDVMQACQILCKLKKKCQQKVVSQWKFKCSLKPVFHLVFKGCLPMKCKTYKKTVKAKKCGLQYMGGL